jgi:hypothetical protein
MPVYIKEYTVNKIEQYTNKAYILSSKYKSNYTYTAQSQFKIEFMKEEPRNGYHSQIV